MAEQNDTGIKGYLAGGTFARYARVKLSSGKVVVAGIADRDIGVALQEANAVDDQIAVALLSKGGTLKMIASAAISEGADVYTAASGKVGASASTAYYRGVAMSASSADGDVIEVLPADGWEAVV